MEIDYDNPQTDAVLDAAQEQSRLKRYEVWRKSDNGWFFVTQLLKDMALVPWILPWSPFVAGHVFTPMECGAMDTHTRDIIMLTEAKV